MQCLRGSSSVRLLAGAMAALLSASAGAATRTPRGVYAVIQAAIPPKLGFMGIQGSPPDLAALLDNPGISGLYLNVGWETFEPKEGQFDFSLFDEAFKLAAARHKTLQIDLLPGFYAPRWLLDSIPSCEQWLQSGSGAGPATCGKADFRIPEGVRHGELLELPLPWNPAYKKAWHKALAAFSERFGPRPEFVSIAITGPTAISEETILPRNGLGETDKWERLLDGRFTDPSYHQTNKAFVDEWKAVIDDYGKIFNNLTLAISRAPGLPFPPPGFKGARETTREIAAYFAGANVGTNRRATQGNGITAWRAMSMSEPRLMTADPSIRPLVISGGMFNTGFDKAPSHVGCLYRDRDPFGCDGITREKAFFNALGPVFKDTPAGHYYNMPDGPTPIHYLQIYARDILYCNGHPEAQAILADANKRILEIAKE